MIVVVASVMLAACTIWAVGGFIATFILVTRRRVALPTGELPGVCVLKPLRGVDVELEKNLETFFTQDYPKLELLFGLQDPKDPAIAVVERLCARFPHVNAHIVVHSNRGGANPKVRNLIGMVAHASYPLVLISDSNVRAPSHYVSELVAIKLRNPQVGMVTNLFAGVGEDGIGAALENVQLNGFAAAGIALPCLCGDAITVGKSLLFDYPTFRALGGFEAVRDVLAEDFVMGKLFARAGYGIVIAPTVLENVTTLSSVRGFVDRQIRWAMLRWRLRTAPVVLEFVSAPLAMLPVAAWLFDLPTAIVWAVSLMLLRDVGGWVLMRGWRRVWLPLLLSPARDVFMLYVWLRSSAKRHISWRGNRMLVGAGTFCTPAPAGR